MKPRVYVVLKRSSWRKWVEEEEFMRRGEAMARGKRRD